MKGVVQLLFITAAVVAFLLAPQASAQKVTLCPPELKEKVNEICELGQGQFEYMKLENILNTEKYFSVSYCWCPGIEVVPCSDTVCSNFGEQILAPDASRVSYSDGLVGSTCKKETHYIDIGGDTVPYTVRVCK